MKKSFMKRLVALALVIVSVFSVSAVALADSDITGTYNNTSVALRIIPDGTVRFRLNEGATCTVHGYRQVNSDIWYRVTILSGASSSRIGTTGWTMADFIDVDSTAVPVFSYASKEDAFGYYELENDDESTYVYNLQVCLKAKGYDIDVDGIFGDETEAAVKKFQNAKALTADGIVGENTKTALWYDFTCRNALSSSGY